MSYIGGIQYSVDNRGDNELSSCIQRADDMEKIKAGIMPMLYTGRVQANSSANYARNYYSQLHDGGVNDRDLSLLQGKGFKDDVIDASSRATQSASRFNYAYDRQVNKRFVDVSGQFIPNNKLRILPNRGCAMWAGGQVLPKPYVDADLQQLSESLMKESINANLAYNPADANSYMKYKANRPKLTRQDLMNAAQQYAVRSVQPLPADTTATATASVAPYNSLDSARRLAEDRRQIAADLRETRAIREGLSVQIPSMMMVGGVP